VKRPFAFLRVVAMAAALAPAAVTSADAQTIVFPAGTRLFESKTDSTARQVFDVALSVSEAYDTDVPSVLLPQLPPTTLQSGGYSTMFVAAADYEWGSPRARLGGNASSALRYYPQLREVTTVSHSAGLGLSARLPKRATLEINQTAAYSPSYLYQLFPAVVPANPGDAIPAAPDYDVDNSESYIYGTTMTLAHGSNRGSRISAAGEFQRTNFVHQSEARSDLTIYGLQGRFSHGVARNAGVSVEYRYRTGEFGYAGPTTEHGVNVGLEYSRPLSVSRRAVFRFNVGSSTLEIPESDARALVKGRQNQLLAALELDYQFLRTWQARTHLRRRFEYVAALGEPVLVDGVSIGVEGMVSRRANLSVAASYASGESTLNWNAVTFDTYAGEVTLTHGVGSALAAYASYLCYFYDSTQNTSLTPALPSVLERSGVRVGLMLWVPALRR
jgi:hypothetical protein